MRGDGRQRLQPFPWVWLCALSLSLSQMDHGALLAQMREKEERKAQEKAEEAAYCEEMRRMKLAVEAHEAKTKHAKAMRAREAAAESMRLMEAHKAAKALEEGSGSSLGRAGDSSRLGAGPASGLVFDGEDPRAAERAALQGIQMREWAEEQVAAKAARAAAERREAEAHARWLAETAEQAEAYERDAGAWRREQAAAVARENGRLAAAAREARAAARAEAGVACELLPAGLGEEHVEDGDASGTLGPGRVRTDHFRGFTEAQQRAVMREQAVQAAEAEAARRRAAVEEARADEEKMLAARRVARYEAEAALAKAARQREHMAALQRQMAETEGRRRQAAEEEAASGPAVGDAFFSKFGQSDR